MLGVAAIAMLADGCGFHALRREVVPPGALSGVDHRRDTVLKAHLRDGQMVVFTTWELVDHDRMIRGTGQLYDVNRRRQGELRMRRAARRATVSRASPDATASSARASPIRPTWRSEKRSSFDSTRHLAGRSAS
jgi:hypothetical protein